MRLKLPDPFLIGLIATVVLATLAPCRGGFATFCGYATQFLIALLFFLHGARLSREAILAGIGAWRVHLVVTAATFLLFPLLGLAARALAGPALEPNMAAGLVFLCVLPSTVQSSIAFTSIARGNVPAAICSASASNLAGVAITPLLVGLLMGAQGGGIRPEAIEAVALQLLAPFVAGHLMRPWLAAPMLRAKLLVSLVDRGSILSVVYVAFSAAVVEGLWRRVSPLQLGVVVMTDAAILAAALAATAWTARALHFSKEDEIATVFCGSKKSLASGVPMAGALFPAALVGPIIVPLMIFHQMQLMVCAALAQRYARRPLAAGAAARSSQKAV
jgi:solute carrier family 10 (sodium/bile acid cotransporter), member 7